MRVLMFSTDRNIFTEGSAVRARMAELGGLVEELHIVVFTKSSHSRNFEAVKISENTMAYATDSASRWLYVFDAVRIGKRIVGNFENEFLITAQGPFETGLAAIFLKKKLGMPAQIQIHTDFLSPYFFRQSLLNRARLLIARYTLPRADCIRAVSERIKSSLGKMEITVLPIYVDAEKFRNPPEEEIRAMRKKYARFDFIFLTVSRLSPEKNIPLALQAMGKIACKAPRAGLIIVGSGPKLETYRRLAARLGLENRVVFEPYAPPKEVSVYYRVSDALLHTSNYEGYGLVLVEAALSGLPIITTDTGIAGEVIEDGASGLVCPVGNVECVSKKMIKFVEDEKMRENFACTAREAAKNLAISKERYLMGQKEAWEACFVRRNG